jgi:hypothetical protein
LAKKDSHAKAQRRKKPMKRGRSLRLCVGICAKPQELLVQSPDDVS